jgi:hypothetical protein
VSQETLASTSVPADLRRAARRARVLQELRAERRRVVHDGVVGAQEIARAARRRVQAARRAHEATARQDRQDRQDRRGG